MREKIEKFLLEQIEPEEYWRPLWLIADIIILIIGFLAKTKILVGLSIAMILIDTAKLVIYIEEKMINERNEEPDKSSEECDISKKT